MIEPREPRGRLSAQSGGVKPNADDTFEMKTIFLQPDFFFYPGKELAEDEIRISIVGSGWELWTIEPSKHFSKLVKLTRLL